MNAFSPELEAQARITRNALGGFTVSWVCPRCKDPQHIAISAQELLDGAVIECENIDECGRYNSYFEIDVEIKGGLYTHPANESLREVA